MEALDELVTATKDFTTDGGVESGQIVVRWKGSADLRAQEPLARVLRTLHDEAVRRGARDVRMDVTELEFMNSSCFKKVLLWIHQVQDMEPEERYHIRFVRNPSRHWQKRSLDALRSFATDLVTIES